MKTHGESRLVLRFSRSLSRMLCRNAQMPHICHPERSEGSRIFSHVRRIDSSASSRNDSCGKVPRAGMKVRVVSLRRTRTLTRFIGEGTGLCRRALIGAQLLLVALAVPFAVAAAELRTVTVLSYPDRPAKLPLWLAQDAGLFTKYGLNVEIKTPNSGEAIADGARNHAADIYVATANWMVSAVGDGADLVFFANTGYSVAWRCGCRRRSAPRRPAPPSRSRRDR